MSPELRYTLSELMASLFSLQGRQALAKENTEKNDASLQLPSQFELTDWTNPNLRNLPHVYVHVGCLAGFFTSTGLRSVFSVSFETSITTNGYV